MQPLLRAFGGINFSKAGCADAIKQESSNGKKMKKALPDYNFCSTQGGPFIRLQMDLQPL